MTKKNHISSLMNKSLEKRTKGGTTRVSRKIVILQLTFNCIILKFHRIEIF